MKRILKDFWEDRAGVILSTELVVVGTVLVLGLITGMTCLQQAVNEELKDVACAMDNLDQSYTIPGIQGCCGSGACCRGTSTAGSSFHNCERQCDDNCTIVGGAVLPSPVVLSCNGCGQCNQCCTSGPVGCSACGNTGCSHCSGSDAACVRETGDIEVRTGVNNMRVSEWPGFRQDLRTVRPASSVITGDPCAVPGTIVEVISESQPIAAPGTPCCEPETTGTEPVADESN